MRFRLVLIVAVLLSAGCAGTGKLGYSEDTAYRLTEQILSGNALPGDPLPKPEVDLLVLRQDIRTLLDEAIPQRLSGSQKLNRLRDLMFADNGLGLRYSAESTLTATETFDKRHGNCLALTSLFIAAARHIGMDAEYQVVSVRPTWDYEGMTMIRYEHIVATGRIGGEQIGRAHV